MLQLSLKILSFFVTYISYICLTFFFGSLIFLLSWYSNTGLTNLYTIDLNNLDFEGIVKSLLFWASIIMFFAEIIKRKISVKIDKKIIILLLIVLFVVHTILFIVPFLRTDDLDIQSTIFGFWTLSIIFLVIYLAINKALVLIKLRAKK